MTTTGRRFEARGQRKDGPFAIRAGRVFDGNASRGTTSFVIDDGRIAEVRPVDYADLGLPTVDLEPSVTLLPGLIDAHVHLAFDATYDAAANVQQVSDAELTDQMRARARAALLAGITTVRDLGDRRYLTLPLRDELASRVDAGPSLLCAGPPVTTAAGHCWFLGGAVADGATAPQLRAAVSERALRGVDVVKVMASGGEMTEGSHAGLVQFEVDDLRVIVDEAHRHGLPVAAHAHAPAGIANALAAGVDTIEHCSFMTADDVVPDDDLVAAIAASGTIVSLTLGMVPGDGPPPPKKIATLMPRLLENMRRLASSGVVVTLGSDAGIAPIKPHDVLPYAVAELAGLTGDTPGALAAATSAAARAVGIGDRKGTLAPGYDADLLAVHGDPIADPDVLRQVVAVYRSGLLVAGGAAI